MVSMENVIILQTCHQVSCKNMYRHVVICHLGLEFNMLVRAPNCQIWWEQKLACFTPAYTKKAPNPTVLHGIKPDEMHVFGRV